MGNPFLRQCQINSSSRHIALFSLWSFVIGCKTPKHMCVSPGSSKCGNSVGTCWSAGFELQACEVPRDRGCHDQAFLGLCTSGLGVVCGVPRGCPDWGVHLLPPADHGILLGALAEKACWNLCGEVGVFPAASYLQKYALELMTAGQNHLFLAVSYCRRVFYSVQEQFHILMFM